MIPAFSAVHSECNTPGKELLQSVYVCKRCRRNKSRHFVVHSV